MVYEPLILHNNKFHTIHISIDNGVVTGIHEQKNMLKALKDIGLELNPIFCGGKQDPWIMEREQWHSGANFGLTQSYQTPAGELLSDRGDADGDGHQNAGEYDSVRAAGGGMQAYVTAAASPQITGDGSLPAAGVPALAVAVAALTLTGIRRCRVLRRRNQK